jgi:hypothetical protein
MFRVSTAIDKTILSLAIIELEKAHNLFEWLISRDTEAGRRAY